MYGQHGNEYSMEFLAHFSLQNTTTAHPTNPSLTPLPSLAIPGNEYDSISAVKSGLGNSSSGCSNIGSHNSITSYGLSTNDLPGGRLAQHKQSLNSAMANEVSIIEGMNKACRYSPDEKKERIERYRNKRNLRNFNKKIKYECRKTLADSRPRIRGRFTKNDEIDKMTKTQLDHAGIEEDDDNWINFLDAFSENLMP